MPTRSKHKLLLSEHDLHPVSISADGRPAPGAMAPLGFLTALLLGLLLLPACDAVGGSEDDDTAPPPAPTALEVASEDGAVRLSWAASGADDLDGYSVYRDTVDFTATEDVAPISGEASLRELSYEDASAENGTTYYYRVTAVDASGNESEASDPVEATPLPSPPERP